MCGRVRFAFPHAGDSFCPIRHDGEDCLVDCSGVSRAYGISHFCVACVSLGVERTGGLEQLVGDFAGNLEHDVEEQQGNVRVKLW